MRLHALWDRAYLLLELGDAGAEQAFAAYEALAKAKDDHDGLAVLTAFFAARRRKGQEATVAAKRFMRYSLPLQIREGFCSGLGRALVPSTRRSASPTAAAPG